MRVAVIITVCLIVAASALGTTVYVTVDVENLRDAPKGNIIGKAHKGQELSVICQYGKWYKVLADWEKCWIWKASTSIAPEDSNAYTSVCEEAYTLYNMLKVGVKYRLPESVALCTTVKPKNNEEFVQALASMTNMPKGTTILVTAIADDDGNIYYSSRPKGDPWYQIKVVDTPFEGWHNTNTKEPLSRETIKKLLQISEEYGFSGWINSTGLYSSLSLEQVF